MRSSEEEEKGDEPLFADYVGLRIQRLSFDLLGSWPIKHD